MLDPHPHRTQHANCKKSSAKTNICRAATSDRVSVERSGVKSTKPLKYMFLDTCKISRLFASSHRTNNDRWVHDVRYPCPVWPMDAMFMVIIVNEIHGYHDRAEQLQWKQKGQVGQAPIATLLVLRITSNSLD